jgi:meiotically up-regulated gene 157 (Mug157) protein
MPRKKATKQQATKPELMLVRADNGDWSLHPPAVMTKEESELVTLMSGTARYVREVSDDQVMHEGWDHPDKRDYELAWQMWAHHLSRSLRK